MKSKLLLITLAITVVFSGAVFAEERFDNVPPVRVLKVALDLTDEQVMDLRELIGARKAEFKEINGEVRELETQLEALLKSDTPDPSEVGGLVLDIRALKQEIVQGHQVYQQDFRELMTPTQVERLRNINKIALADRAAEVLGELSLH